LFVWLAVDRQQNRIVDFEIGDRSFSTYFQMALRLESSYKIDYLCSDEYEVYKKYKISEKHIASKSETCLIEAKNSSIRDCLARFNRKTKRYSKSLEMMQLSLYLWAFYKNFGVVVNCF